MSKELSGYGMSLPRSLFIADSQPACLRMTGRYLQRRRGRVDPGDIKAHARNLFAQNAAAAADLQGRLPLGVDLQFSEQFLFKITNPGGIE